MAEPRLEGIKKAGYSRALFNAVSRRLWDLRNAAVEAEKERLKHFKKHIANAKKAIEEAEMIYAEWRKVDRE